MAKTKQYNKKSQGYNYPWHGCYSRGDIVYIYADAEQAQGHEQHAGRPAVIVSEAVRNTCMVVYLTTNMERLTAEHVKIKTAARPSVAICDQIKTVDAHRMGGRYGQVTPTEMAQISGAITRALALPSENTAATINLEEQLIQARAVGEAWKEVALERMKK